MSIKVKVVSGLFYMLPPLIYKNIYTYWKLLN